MTFQIRNARVLTPDRTWANDCPVTFRDGKIIAVGDPVPADEIIDLRGHFLAPGLLDMHTHGRIGYDFATATAEQMREAHADYARHGVTAVFATLASATPAEWLTAIDRIREAGYEGIHFEGRYLNPKKRGAHAPELLAAPRADDLARFLDRVRIPCHVTAALELDEDGSFASLCRERGATLALGHTNATFAEAQTALRRGATCFTHLCNAMPPLHHREGGPICAALTSPDAYAELIVDGMHVVPEMVDLLWRVLGPDRLVLITDSLSPAGKGDGNYTSAGLPIVVRNGRAETLDGVLAGSTLDLWTAVRNLMKFTGASLADALTCASRNPARAVGLDDIFGSVAVGCRADLIAVADDLSLAAVWQAGRRV